MRPDAKLAATDGFMCNLAGVGGFPHAFLSAPLRCGAAWVPEAAGRRRQPPPFCFVCVRAALCCAEPLARPRRRSCSSSAAPSSTRSAARPGASWTRGGWGRRVAGVRCAVAGVVPRCAVSQPTTCEPCPLRLPPCRYSADPAARLKHPGGLLLPFTLPPSPPPCPPTAWRGRAGASRPLLPPCGTSPRAPAPIPIPIPIAPQMRRGSTSARTRRRPG